MDGLMPGVPSDAKAAGWLAGQVLLHYMEYGLAFVLQRLCSTVHVCIPDDSGVTANIQVYKSEWSCHGGHSTVYYMYLKAVSRVPREYIPLYSMPDSR
jgi:hypothetical protein